MANESLIRGAAMAAPKFNPAAESFQKGFASSFEGISKSYAEEAEKLKALEEKRAKDAEKLYADKPLVEEGKIPSKFQKPFAQASMNLKNQYADLVKNKASMDPLEFIDKQNEYKSKVDGLNKQINALAEWQADFIETSGETGNDLWSQSMTADEQSLVQSIFDGELPMENRDGVVGFIKGKDFYPLDNLPKPKVRADIENNALSLQAEALGEIAAKGYDPKGYTFQNKLKSLKRGIDALNKDTAMSLYVDFAKAAGENGVVADKLKEMPLEEIKNKIYDFYKSPAEQIGAEAYKEYQRRTAPKGVKPTKSDISEQKKQAKFSNLLNDFEKDPFSSLKQTTIGSQVSKDGNVISIVTAKAEEEGQEDEILKFDITNYDQKIALMKLWAQNSGLFTNAEASDFNTFAIEKVRGSKGEGFNYSPGENIDPTTVRMDYNGFKI